MVCCLDFAAPTTTIEQQQQNYPYSHLPPRYIGRPWISFFHCASHEMSLIVKDCFTQIPELAELDEEVKDAQHWFCTHATSSIMKRLLAGKGMMGIYLPAAVAARSCFWFKLWLRSERRSLRCSLGIWCCCRCLPPPCPRIAPTRSRTRLPDPPRGGLTFEGHSRSSQWGGYLQRWPGLLFCGPGHHFLSDCDGFLLGIGISERT